LAFDYFDLRSADAQRRLLDDTVKAFQSALQLTEDRYNGGASPLSDVTQARTLNSRQHRLRPPMSTFIAPPTNMRLPF
jgi:outer membrane protein TolC